MDLKDFEKHIITKIEAGRSIEAVRHIIKTRQYAEQDRRESLKETFKPITDELEKADEGIYELKDELKDLKAIEGPPALPAIEEPVIEGKKKKKSKEPVSISLHEVIEHETIETAKAYGYPDPMEILDLRDDTQKLNELSREVGKDLKSLGGKKRHAKGKERDELDKTIKDLQDYKTNLEGQIKLFSKPQKGSGIFYYNNPRDRFDRLHFLGGSIMAGNNSAKNEFSEVAHTLHKLGAFPSEDLNSLLSKFLLY